MIDFIELLPNNGQKSFGGKAQIVRSDHVYVLYSYHTPIAMIIRNGGSNFVRLWDGYSLTTMRHINAFRSLYGLDAISKKQWEKIPVNDVDVDIVEDMP